MMEKICKCGCGREIQATGKGRPGEYASGACRVYRRQQKDVTKVSSEVTKCPPVIPPRCTAWVKLDGRGYHPQNTSEAGHYDAQGNYWCADCKERLELMNVGERLDYPEICYFPHNPDGMRAVQIPHGSDQWARRLAEMDTPDTSASWHNIHYQIKRLSEIQDNELKR